MTRRKSRLTISDSAKLGNLWHWLFFGFYHFELKRCTCEGQFPTLRKTKIKKRNIFNSPFKMFSLEILFLKCAVIWNTTSDKMLQNVGNCISWTMNAMSIKYSLGQLFFQIKWYSFYKLKMFPTFSIKQVKWNSLLIHWRLAVYPSMGALVHNWELY